MPMAHLNASWSNYFFELVSFQHFGFKDYELRFGLIILGLFLTFELNIRIDSIKSFNLSLVSKLNELGDYF
jgi:hypothetical protein